MNLAGNTDTLERATSGRCIIGIKELNRRSDYPVDIWFDSLKSAASVLSPENRELMEVIKHKQPKTTTELANLTGRAVSNVSRTLKTLNKHQLITLDAARYGVASINYHDFVILMGSSESPVFSPLEEAIEVLRDIALVHTPAGTENQAIVDQWLHALATDSQFYCDQNENDPERLRSYVEGLLKKRCVFFNQKQFHDLVFSGTQLKPRFDSRVKFIDLFAGIGGMRLGFQNIGGECVFSSEFDKQAQITYKKNYGEYPFGDITMINPDNIPAHDVLLAGFPCQPFSHAGLKKGIEDTRGTLFHDIARIIAAKQPKFAVLENVKGLVSHEKGSTLKVILKTLIDLGYSCNVPREVIVSGSTKEIQNYAKKMVLKSIDFGVPQNRQRIYIVLWRDGLIDKFEYPVARQEQTTVADILEKSPDPKLTISDRLWAGHKRRKLQNAKNGKGFGYGLVTPDSAYTNTRSARYYKDGSEILIDQEPKNPRKISTREAARLQGYPEEFVVSDSNVQAYKQFGNSVTVSVVQDIAERVFSYLNSETMVREDVC